MAASTACTDVDTNNASTSATEHKNDPPVCIIILGMAGSGKTTFVQVKPSVSFVLQTETSVQNCCTFTLRHRQCRDCHVKCQSKKTSGNVSIIFLITCMVILTSSSVIYLTCDSCTFQRTVFVCDDDRDCVE